MNKKNCTNHTSPEYYRRREFHVMNSESLEWGEIQIESARLVLRPPREDDTNQYLEALTISKHELQAWLGFTLSSIPINDVREGIRNWIRDIAEQRQLRFFTFDKTTDQFIGTIWLVGFDWSVYSCELGGWVKTDQTCKSYASEMVSTITKFLFEIWGMRRIEVRVWSGNEASLKVVRRLGFEEEGILRNAAVLPNGSFTNVYILSCLNETEKQKPSTKDIFTERK